MPIPNNPSTADVQKLKQQLFDKFYENLNERQREAVYQVNGPLLVLAGAGSGKTTVLVKRIAHLIRFGNAYYDRTRLSNSGESDIALMKACLECGSRDDIGRVLSGYAIDQVAPWSILAFTFTNKAAKEIKTRIHDELGNETIADDIWTGTFHSICVRILRKYGDRVGYQPDFTIYDTDDIKKVISNVMKDLDISDKILPVRTVMTEISNAKNRLLNASDFQNEAGTDYRLAQIGKIFLNYEKQMFSSNAVDFDDIITQTVKLLSEHPDVRDYYQNKFRYVLVDEYQDTNIAQFRLTSLLAGKYRNLMVVGDDDQSIYKFRGATIENILTFDKTYPDAKVIKLEQNYRSTQTILNASNAVIRNNVGRKGKELWTAGEEGEPLHLEVVADQNEEARYLCDVVRESVSKGEAQYRDFAILYRMNAQANSLESAFAKSGIPYRVLGGVRFYDRKEIKDVLAYLCLIHNHADNFRLKRVINEPKRKIGTATVDAVEQLAIAENTSMFEVMKRSDSYVSLARTSSKLKEFTSLIDSLTALVDTIPLSDLITQVVVSTGYRDMLTLQGEEGLERLENVEEMLSTANEYTDQSEEGTATLAGFLEEVALVSDVDKYDDTADAVVMMTIHSAKGLEFPVVMLPGLEEGIFPGSQCMFDEEETEEERRLAYVALTRAKKRLYLVRAQQRMLYGRTEYRDPSRFIGEIPATLIETDSQVPTRTAVPQSYRSPSTSAVWQTVTPSSNIVNKQSPAAAAVVPQGRAILTSFNTGDRVEHMKFGLGTVLSSKKMGSDYLVEIAFDETGTKKIMASYAKLKRAEE